MGARLKAGTVFVAPLPGSNTEFENSVTFVTLDESCRHVLILDGGHTVYKEGSIVHMNWKVEDWLNRGWILIES